MIARLWGDVIEKGPGHVVIAANSVGYRVELSSVSLDAAAQGGRCVLRIHTHVREDALELFGFVTAEEEAMFHRLLGLKNIGPRAALRVLSGISVADLERAIQAGNPAPLAKIHGVGPKTAARIVAEMKAKATP